MHQSVELLRQKSVALALALAPSQAEAVDLVPLFTDELVWVMAPEHPWAKCPTVAGRNCRAETDLGPRQQLHVPPFGKAFWARRHQAETVLEVGSLEAVKEGIGQGLGIAALSPWVVQRELQEKTLVALPLGRRKLRRNWCALRSLDRKSNLAEETFVKLCQTAAVALTS